MVFLALFFYVPIYRTARSKGYPARRIVSATIFYTFVVALTDTLAVEAGVDHWGLNLSWLPISLVLIVLQVLPKRAGAPGQAWFTIQMQCPECGRTNDFDRDRIGLVESCPGCKEIFTVSSDSSEDLDAEGAPGAAPDVPTQIHPCVRCVG